MSEPYIGNNFFTTEIPVEFWTDLPLSLPIKIQPHIAMNQMPIISEKPLIPALFQIAAHADEIKSLSVRQNSFVLNRIPIAENMMLNPEKLAEILDGLAQKKKATGRRFSANRFGKNFI